MKRLIVIFLSALLCVCSYAGKKKTSVYCNLNLCGVTFVPLWVGDSAALSLSFSSYTGYKFVTTPVLMLRTMNGDVMKIEGQALAFDSREEASNSFIGIGLPGTGLFTGFGLDSQTTYTASAIFYLTKEQMMKLKDGIIKIRLNTIPAVLEKEFKKDKIGVELYRIFREAKWDQEDF